MAQRTIRSLRIDSMGGFFSLDGYGRLLLDGTWVTIKLSIFSLAVAFLLGLLGASAKLSRSRAARAVATAYTTLIRAVPDLVLMLLLFYGIQNPELAETLSHRNFRPDPAPAACAAQTPVLVPIQFHQFYPRYGLDQFPRCIVDFVVPA